MTLLELLVEKGRKHTWGWAKAARWAKGRQDVVAWRIIDEAEVDFIANSSGEKVTKEQYEEALAATKEQKMKYEYLKGSEKDFEGAPEWAELIYMGNVRCFVGRDGKWMNDGSAHAFSDFAIHIGNLGLKRIAERQPITEPSWDGVGLPPVGCEVEFKAEDGGWGAGTVLFVGEKRIFWRCHEDNMEYNCEISPPEFRQIHSEADKKRDEAINAMRECLGHASGLIEVSNIYTAIAAGKIPGVKLED